MEQRVHDFDNMQPIPGSVKVMYFDKTLAKLAE